MSFGSFGSRKKKTSPSREEAWCSASALDAAIELGKLARLELGLDRRLLLLGRRVGRVAVEQERTVLDLRRGDVARVAALVLLDGELSEVERDRAGPRHPCLERRKLAKVEVLTSSSVVGCVDLDYLVALTHDWAPRGHGAASRSSCGSSSSRPLLLAGATHEDLRLAELHHIFPSSCRRVFRPRSPRRELALHAENSLNASVRSSALGLASG